MKKPAEEQIKSKLNKLEKKIANRDRKESPLSWERSFSENLINTAQAVVLILDTDGKIVMFNNYMELLSGYKLDDVKGRDWFETFLPESDRKHIKEIFLKAIKGIKTRGEVNPIIARNGQKILIEWHDSTLKDENGNTTGLLSTGQDVTEKIYMTKMLAQYHDHLEMLVEKRTNELSKSYRQLREEIKEREKAEKELQNKKTEWVDTFNAIKDWVILIDTDFRILQTNRAVEKILGISVDSVVGKRCFELIHGTNKCFPDCPVPNMMKRLKREEVEMQLPNGLWVMVTADPLINNEGKIIGAVHIVRDISDRKRIEQHLVASKKMEMMSTLAGGIAHQFNNALSVITANVDMLEMDFPYDARITNHTEPVRNSARRMANLTSQLLASARGGRYRSSVITFSDLINETLDLLKPRINSSIHMDLDLPDDISGVEADMIQMQMVISAILENASEAIEDEGRITISCRNIDISNNNIEDLPGLSIGKFVCMKIEDNGHGMDEITRNRMFDPFFTTKFRGRGLGMAAAYGIVKNHGGGIFVDSEAGEGTSVNVYLPAAEMESEIDMKPNRSPLKGTGTILVIEDEENVVETIRSMLGYLGYRFIAVANGKDAVKICKTFDGEIDLAILDAKLPDMNVDEVYEKVKGARPNLKVLVCSGYLLDEQIEEILKAGAKGFIKKPFSLVELSEKLDIMLKRKEK